MPKPPPPAAPRPLRLGVHGSSPQPARIVAAAGYDPARVAHVLYDVREPFRLLRAGGLDLMLVKYALHEPDIVTSAPVTFDPRAALVRAGHPLAARDTLSVEDVAPYDAFHCPGDFPPYVWDEIVPLRTPRGRPIRRVRLMGTPADLVATLTGSDAVHLSFLSLEGSLPPGIRVIPVPDLPAAPVSLAWLRDAPPSPERDAFVAAAERSALATTEGGALAAAERSADR
ncbi:LysR substrate-binding domain-containing protein [Streptomyces cinerochromogenes]|uniref:LysR substrate-binding domain-containing protein n=1 Tax=Streptomyces cinerochromogenes TaxID=66422 RepID=A0ABW7BK61_9ACTN